MGKDDQSPEFLWFTADGWELPGERAASTQLCRLPHTVFLAAKGKPFLNTVRFHLYKDT